jgi:hypothetical protein
MLEDELSVPVLKAMSLDLLILSSILLHQLLKSPVAKSRGGYKELRSRYMSFSFVVFPLSTVLWMF